MTTLSNLADALGIDRRTITNNKKQGYQEVRTSKGDVDVTASIRAYVEMQANRIRTLSTAKAHASGGKEGNDDLEYWKVEKEKMQAFKLRRENYLAEGDLIPSEALFELLNGPLSFVRNHLVSLPSTVQKRCNSFDPQQLKIIDETVREGLRALEEKHGHELKSTFEQIIQRYAKYYPVTYEDSDSSLGGETSEP